LACVLCLRLAFCKQHLHVPASQVFLLTGRSICVVSILRLPVLIAAAKSKDPTGDNPAVAKWSIVELNVAIICASLTTLRPLILRCFPALIGSEDGDGPEFSSYGAMRQTVEGASTLRFGVNRHDSLRCSGNTFGSRHCESADQASSDEANSHVSGTGGQLKEERARGTEITVSIGGNEV
jgi:hypothetical protein